MQLSKIFIKILKGSENAEGAPTVTILTRSKESNTENFNKFYETLSGNKIGHFVKDNFEGNFYKEMKKDMKGRDLNLADVSGKIFIFPKIPQNKFPF